MKVTLSIALVLIMYLNTFSQVVFNYSYSNSGNRELRNMTTLRIASEVDPSAQPSLLKFFEDMADSALSNKTNSLAIDVYPNPTSDEIQVVSINLTSGIEKFRILDQKGQVLYSIDHPGDSFVVSMGNYSSGTYFAWILSRDKVYRLKIVKH